MNAFNTNINQSDEINGKIRNICANYWQLMVDCAKDEALRADFIKSPHPYLKEVGMVVPEGAKVLLDSENAEWPVVFIKTKDGKIQVQEQKLGVNLTHTPNSGKEQNENILLKSQGEVEIKVQQALKDCDVVVKLPFLDAQMDMLNEVKFADGAEIILSGIC